MTKSEPEALYRFSRGVINALLASLGDCLRDHEARAREHPEDWGYTGDLAEVEKKLAEALGFLRYARTCTCPCRGTVGIRP